MKIDKAIELAAIGELKVAGESGNQGEAFVIEGDSRTAGWTTISYDSVLSQEVITNEDVALAHLLVHCFNRFPSALDHIKWVIDAPNRGVDPDLIIAESANMRDLLGEVEI